MKVILTTLYPDHIFLQFAASNINFYELYTLFSKIIVPKNHGNVLCCSHFFQFAFYLALKTKVKYSKTKAMLMKK